MVRVPERGCYGAARTGDNREGRGGAAERRCCEGQWGTLAALVLFNFQALDWMELSFFFTAVKDADCVWGATRL